ncbi:MAG: hypothetical protein EPO08_08665 [Rhodospirillaceae bacterium]|nr:MAG: hypothetical protein EPO08_08665 [Rhodospirillaceae bacterium]
MSEETEISNKALMVSVARGFKEGDLRPLFDSIDDNIIWKSMSPTALFRFGGVHAQRLGVKEVTAFIFATYHFREVEALEIIAEGDTLWGLFKCEVIHLPTRRTVKSDLAIRWVVRNNKIVEHQGFFDTAGMLMQQDNAPGLSSI